MVIKTIMYKGEEIELNPNGLYSAFIMGKGWLKADTLLGIKKLINEAKK